MRARTRTSKFLLSSGKERPAAGFIAGVFCACLISVFFLSSAFILTCAGHDHDHDGPDGSCATCAHMATAEALLEQLCAIAAVTRLCLCFDSFALKFAHFDANLCAFVRLKIRMNC